MCVCVCVWCSVEFRCFVFNSLIYSSASASLLLNPLVCFSLQLSNFCLVSNSVEIHTVFRQSFSEFCEHFMTITLDSLSGRLLISISLRSFKGEVLSSSFVSDTLPAFLILLVLFLCAKQICNLFQFWRSVLV